MKNAYVWGIIALIFIAIFGLAFFYFAPKNYDAYFTNIGSQIAGTNETRYYSVEEQQRASSRYIEPTSKQVDLTRYYDDTLQVIDKNDLLSNNYYTTIVNQISDGNFTRNVFIDGNLTLNGVIKHSTCPSGYVLVPGDSNFGTNDFCVMKYEAKANAIYQPISVAAGTPWVSISWYSAKDACKRAGAHLITNAEWMTIARNIESQTINWQSGQVGTRCMFGGHMDNNPASALAADVDSNPYAGTGDSAGAEVCPFNTTGTGNASRRTMTLSNGNVVWDISGNVWEWVDEQCDTTNWPTASWTEWSSTSAYVLNVAGPARADFNSSYGVGKYYGCSLAGNGLVRGASWGSGVSAGVFALVFNNATSYSYTNVGFRCVR